MPSRSGSASIAEALALVLLLGACGGEPTVPAPPRTCTFVVPNACTAPAPSYAADVSPLITAHCVPCHMPGGMARDRPLLTHAQVFSRRGTVLDQIRRCKMPPPEQPPLTDAEANTLMNWFVCDAPNN
jgi:hypothetical protein